MGRQKITLLILNAKSLQKTFQGFSTNRSQSRLSVEFGAGMSMSAAGLGGQ